MATVEMKDISVSYGKNQIINKLSIDVRDGESLAIVGPSSCGKTSLLRALCGFIKITEGEISVRGQVVSSPARRISIAPERRKIGVVFQDYAVWPHLTVLENIAYPLKKRKVAKTEARERALKALALVRMAEFGDRLPSQLSGGQQQRVALARALVSSTDLIVLDEPITNLDATLREEMAYEIRNLQHELGVTVLYITHDQETAMTISDRMAIMDNTGHIRQVGTAETVWTKPTDKYVFEFLGVSNFLPVEFHGGKMLLKDGDGFQRIALPNTQVPDRNDLLVAFRPMDVQFTSPDSEHGFVGTVKRVTYLGNQFDYIVQVADQEIRVQQDSFDALQHGVPEEGSLQGLKLVDPVFYSREGQAGVVV